MPLTGLPARRGAPVPAHHMAGRDIGRRTGDSRVICAGVPRRGHHGLPQVDVAGLRKLPHRALQKVALMPEKTWAVAGGDVSLKAGATFDGSDREGSATSPLVELARSWNTSSGLQRIYASFAETTQVPSYTALNSSPTSGLFLGNPNLGREYSRTAQVGVRGAVAGWTAQADLFYRDDTDLVDWTYNPAVFGRQANPVDLHTSGGRRCSADRGTIAPSSLARRS